MTVNVYTSLVTHKQKSLDVDLHLIVKNTLCLFHLLFYIPVNSYCHVGMLAVEKDVKQLVQQTKIPFHNKTQIFVQGFSLMCDDTLQV